jgi:hypothetical protein
LISGGRAVLLPAHLRDVDLERFARYRENLNFFQGQQEPLWPGRRRRALVANYARTLVRKTASYLMGNPPAVRVASSLGPDATQAAQREMDRMSAFNRLPLADYEVAVDAAVLGDGAFRLAWDPERATVAVAPVDMQRLWVWWGANRRPVRVAELLLQPTGPGDPTVVQEWTELETITYVDGATLRTEINPYGLLPYVVFPNERRPLEPWGESDLEDLKGPCRELNRRLSVVAQVLEVSGNPIVVLENVRGSENIQVEPGALWELPEQSRAYLLDLLSGGGVRLHLEYIDLLYRVVHDLAEVPRTAFGDTSGRLHSGVALQLELQPLLQKVERRRAVWSEVIAERARLALRIAETHGSGPFGDVQVTVQWPPLISAIEIQQDTAWYPAEENRRTTEGEQGSPTR